jgi:ATP-binding cassette subfamily B protein
MTRFNAILNTLSPAISSFHTALTDAQKVVAFISKVSKMTDPDDAVVLTLMHPPLIEFRDVSFSYKNKIILNKVNFSIQPGQKLAIVGATGAGKSTILNLLLRFYIPDSGQIFINDCDIATLSAESLRQHIAVVAQSSTLFNHTVAENIRYGYLTACDEDVRKAAELAKLDINKLPEIAGQGGGKLSGGERQRTTIARAVLKGGPIFLLDEPTSALDPETERDVQETLDDLTIEATTIVVTHRLNTIINAHHILYLKDGVIAEQGTFSELIAKKGLFYNQFRVQCQELGMDADHVQPTRRTNPTSMSFARNGQNFWRSRQAAQAVQDPSAASETTPLLGSK